MAETETAADARKRLVYEESTRAIQQQQASLDNLRARTGLLLAAASISSSFLGGQALSGEGLTPWSWFAIGALAAVGLCTILVLLPRRNWFFSNDVQTLLNGYVNHEHPATLDEMHVAIATYNQEHWTANQKTLNKLFAFFRVACAALVIEVAFWLVALGTA